MRNNLAKKIKANKLDSTSGFSLIEVMVVGGIMLTLGLGAATLMDQQSKQFKSIRTYANRDSIVASANSEIAKPLAVLISTGGVRPDPTDATAPMIPRLSRNDVNNTIAPANAALYDCLWGPANSCVNTTTNPTVQNRWRDFYFIPTTAQTLNQANALGGPPGSFTLDAANNFNFTQVAAQRPAPGAADTSAAGSQAVRFDINGRRCAPTETVGVCPLILRTQFQVACKASAVTCGGEGTFDQINLRYVFHNLLSGQDLGGGRGTSPVMLDKSRNESITDKQIAEALKPGNSPNECRPGEVTVSATGAATPVCARARTQALNPAATNCAYPRVLRVREVAGASELFCELPLSGNAVLNPTTFTGSSATAVSSSSTAAAQGGVGACPSPMVATGIAQDGSLRCEYPIKQSSRDSFPMVSPLNYQSLGWCAAPYIVQAIAKDGSIQCGLPLMNNLAVTGTLNSSGGACSSGMMVTAVGSDGAVKCAAPSITCTNPIQTEVSGIIPAVTQNASASCGSGEIMTGYQFSAGWWNRPAGPAGCDYSSPLLLAVGIVSQNTTSISARIRSEQAGAAGCGRFVITCCKLQ